MIHFLFFNTFAKFLVILQVCQNGGMFATSPYFGYCKNTQKEYFAKILDYFAKKIMNGCYAKFPTIKYVSLQNDKNNHSSWWGSFQYSIIECFFIYWFTLLLRRSKLVKLLTVSPALLKVMLRQAGWSISSKRHSGQHNFLHVQGL